MKPGADLAIHPGIEIAGIGLHPRQALRQHRQSLDGLGVGVRMRLARAQAFDAVIDGADAGRQKQPFRRVYGDGGVEDRRTRHHLGMGQSLLDLGVFVGDPGNGAEFAAGNRGGYADLTHRWWIQLRDATLVGADPVDILDAPDVIGEADLHRLGAVGDRAAADRDDEVGAGGAGLLGGCDHGGARRMRRHGIERADATRAQRRLDFRDLVGSAVQCAADHQEGADDAEAVDLRHDRLGGGGSENHLVHGAEHDTALVHDCPPEGLGLVATFETI
jgi:hypothetical protein